MRSALFLRFPFLLLLLITLAHGQPPPQQVNPHTQIRWPISCTAQGMTYSYQTNTCVKVGPVGGGTGEVQFNTGGIWTSIPGFTFDTGSNTLSAPNLTVPGTANVHIPPSGVQWPPACTSGVYVPASNTCVASGTAANPGGSIGQVQFNVGGSFGGIGNVTGNAVSFPGSLIANSLLTNSEFSLGTCATAATIDPANGNRQSMNLTAGNTCILSFTQPVANTVTVQLRIIQAGGSANGDIVGGAWPGGIKPTITPVAGAIDIISCYLDGTNTYCAPLQNFSQAATTTPVVTPGTGSYDNDQSVTISNTQTGAVNRYCTDIPGTCIPATLYATPITINATGTHARARSTAPGYAASPISDQQYTLKVGTPTLTPGSGFAIAPQSVTLTSTTTGAGFVYCTDTTGVCTPATPYSAPVTVPVNNFLRAQGTRANYTSSVVGVGAYTSKGRTSGCNASSSPATTSIACGASIALTAGDRVYVSVASTSGGCPAGNPTDITGFPAGSTVTVLNHCVVGGGSHAINTYQVLVSTTGSYTPACTIPSQTFPAILADGFSGLTTGIVGSVQVTQVTGTAGLTATGPTLSPTTPFQIIYGAHDSNQWAGSSVVCTGNVVACALTQTGFMVGYSAVVIGSTSTVATITTGGTQTGYIMTGMVLQ